MIGCKTNSGSWHRAHCAPLSGPWQEQGLGAETVQQECPLSDKHENTEGPRRGQTTEIYITSLTGLSSSLRAARSHAAWGPNSGADRGLRNIWEPLRTGLSKDTWEIL